MGAFNSAVITKKGQELLAKVLYGNTKLEFTQIKTSEKPLSGDLAILTNIGTVKQAEKVASIVRQNAYNVKVSTSFTNNGLTAGYYIRNIGLYAMDPTEGEILYSISVADESVATADYMPPTNGVSVSSLMVDLITAVSNASNVELTVDPTATATVAQLMEVNNHLTALDNSITTAERYLRGSIAGEIKITKIMGKCEQDAEPTPEDPQEIKTAVVSKVYVCGSNLLKNTAVSKTVGNVSFTVNKDNSVTAIGTATEVIMFKVGNIPLYKGVTYVCGNTVPNIGFSLRTNSGGVVIHDFALSSEYTPTKDIVCEVFIRVGQGVTVNATVYPMIRLASVSDSTYKPYTEEFFNLSSSVSLSGVDGVSDAIVEKNGVYGIEKRFFKYTLTGDETFRIGTEGAYAWIQFNSWFNEFLPKSAGKVMCNRFKYEDWKTTTRSDGVVTVDTNPWLRFYCAEFTSVEAVKQFFKDNETSIIYELAEPIFEPLPVEDRGALMYVQGYDGVTHLFTDSEVDTTIEAEYGTNKVGAYALAGMLIAKRIEFAITQE